MSNHGVYSNPLVRLSSTASSRLEAPPLLAASITKAASKQTYYTIRFLVDHDRVPNAYRAYAYFRWVDNALDEEIALQKDRVAFLEREQALVDSFYQAEYPTICYPEEFLLKDLIESDREQNSGLHAYIRNMMAVMAFDTKRRGRLITERELAEYTDTLATAVTEALHYFIGHDDPKPQSAARYLAVTGSHITHMLRDAFEDTAAGYFNIPCEFIDAYKLDLCDFKHDAYHLWVYNRVQLARQYFTNGRGYLAQIKNLRCRLAGYAYIARFEAVLNAIEKDNYQLRPSYTELKSWRAIPNMGSLIASMLLKDVSGGLS